MTTTQDGGSENHGLLGMVALVAAGSTIYDLPYFLLGPLRPVALETFNLSNTKAGIIMAVYGILNLVLYLPGGSMADELPIGALMIFGLVLTGLGGFYMATFPPFLGLCCLLCAWSFSSILLYWAAFVRSMRYIGRPDAQGWSWATYTAATGIVGAVKLTLIVEYFGILLPRGAEDATLQEKRHAIQCVLWVYSVLPFLAAILIAVALPLRICTSGALQTTGTRETFSNCLQVCADPRVWLMSFVLLAMYFCLSVNFYFPQFAMNGYGLSAVDAARIGTICAWTKPFTAVMAGYMAHRIRSSTVCAVGLAVLSLLFAFMGMTTPQRDNIVELVIFVALATVAGDAIFSIYWALLQETGIAGSVTGTAVGIISFVGYSPDAFSPPWLGYIMDTHPGVAGNQRTMIVGAAFATFGFATTLCLSTLVDKKGSASDDDLECKPLVMPR